MDEAHNIAARRGLPVPARPPSENRRADIRKVPNLAKALKKITLEEYRKREEHPENNCPAHEFRAIEGSSEEEIVEIDERPPTPGKGLEEVFEAVRQANNFDRPESEGSSISEPNVEVVGKELVPYKPARLGKKKGTVPERKETRKTPGKVKTLAKRPRLEKGAVNQKTGFKSPAVAKTTEKVQPRADGEVSSLDTECASLPDAYSLFGEIDDFDIDDQDFPEFE